MLFEDEIEASEKCSVISDFVCVGESARAYFMCENPAVVCHLMPCVIEVDGRLRAEKQRALETSHCGAGVGGGREVDEGHRPAAAAVPTAGQQPQPSESRAAVITTLTFAHTRTPVSNIVYLIGYPDV